MVPIPADASNRADPRAAAAPGPHSSPSSNFNPLEAGVVFRNS